MNTTIKDLLIKNSLLFYTMNFIRLLLLILMFYLTKKKKVLNETYSIPLVNLFAPIELKQKKIFIFHLGLKILRLKIDFIRLVHRSA